jgi:Ca2+-binding RTX toxin-like protein
VAVGQNSSFRDITGSNADETLSVRSGTIGNANLGGGFDVFWYQDFPAYGLPASVVQGVVDGGAGTDWIILSVGGGITVDMAMTTGFEVLDTGTWTSATSDVRVINANGFSRINTDHEGRLVIGQSYSPEARVGLSFPTILVLESTATVGHIGFDWDVGSITEGQAANSTSVTNEGTVLGDVRLYTGNDLYDGRLGTVGGGIYGFAGDDHLRGSAAGDRMWGGYGNDRLEGNDGDDQLYGDSGNDQIDGGAGNDRVDGGAGNDVLHLWKGGGDDVALGGSGNDTFFFGGALTSADVVGGGEGTDTLVLQGPYGALVLSPNVTQIENISILGGGNTAFGEPGTNRHDYVLTTHDSNFAAGCRPESTLRPCWRRRISPSTARRRRMRASSSTAAGAGTL